MGNWKLDEKDALGFLGLTVVMGSGKAIEHMEAQGQRDLVAAAAAAGPRKARLPKKIQGDYQESNTDIEAAAAKMGIVLGADVDDLFREATLPEGWRVVPTNHSMWSDLLDANGRKRAAIFYKAAFYDRAAHLNFIPRYTVERRMQPDEKKLKYGTREYCKHPITMAVYDNKTGQDIFVTPPQTSSDLYVRIHTADHSELLQIEAEVGRAAYSAAFEETADARASAVADAWRAERFPDWRKTGAYWLDP